MRIQLDRFQQKRLFLLIVTAIYIALVIWLDFLQAPAVWDEKQFWESSLAFSDRLIPTIDDLRNYGELSTPLPFILFGALEHLFHQGLFAGRLLNLLLSLTIISIIGWPTPDKRGRAFFCFVGLSLCPYYYWYGVLMYTDIIACLFGLIGVMSYIRDRHLLSCAAFILAIASRQYMVAFPAAISTYEFTLAIALFIRSRQFRLIEQWRWLAPLIATLSLLGWFYLFQGLAPETAVDIRNVPDVQKTTWAFTPGYAINFLAFIGFYIVIPEFLLFKPSSVLHSLKRQRRKIALIALALLLCLVISPPALIGLGTVLKIANLLPYDPLKLALFYGLAMLACIRFSQLNLMSLFVFFNSLIMMKAYPWDKYILPLVIIFWYLKSVGLEEKFSFKALPGILMLRSWLYTRLFFQALKM